MRLSHGGWAVLLWMPLAASGMPAPQQGQGTTQGSAVADAAKAARDAKKDQPKATRVWDNDTIPTVPGNINVVGQTPAENGTGNDASGGAPAEDKASLERDLADAKDKLQSLQTDLDILQRTYSLDQQAYYGKPDFQNDPAGAKKLKDEQAAIDDKQQQIEEMQKKIADLEDKANAARESKAENAGANSSQSSSAPSANAGGNNASAAAGGSNQAQSGTSTAPVPNN
jgi:hypothetical protein